MSARAKRVTRKGIGEAVYALGVAFAGISTAPSEGGHIRYAVRYRPPTPPEAEETPRLRSTRLYEHVEDALTEALAELAKLGGAT